MQERRRGTRYYAPEMLYFSDGKKLFKGIMNDISCSGMFIITKVRLPVGKRVSILLNVSKDINFIDGRIAREATTGMGVRFQDEIPVEAVAGTRG